MLDLNKKSEPLGYIGKDGECLPLECDKCQVVKADRGWFYRRHQYCISEFVSGCAAGYDSYNLVMTYAILCGILWMAAGGIATFASTKMEKMWIMISAGMFFFGYVLFIGLFGPVMVEINVYNKETLGPECSAVKKKLRRSGDEFIGFSVCSFIFIFGAIVCNTIPIFALESPQKGHDNAQGDKQEQIKP